VSRRGCFNDTAVFIVSCHSETVIRKTQHIPHTKLNRYLHDI